MRKNKNIIAFCVAIVIFSMIMPFVHADSEIKAVAATIEDYIFKYKGKEVTLTSTTSKKTMQPLKYNNEIYVPVGSIADLLKVAVRHDESNKIIELGAADSRGHSLLDVEETGSNDIKYFIKTVDPDVLTIGKTSFDFGLALLNPRKNTSYSRTFTLGKQYERLNFSSIVSSTTKKENVEVKFIDVDRKMVLSIIDVSSDKTVQEYSVKVTGVNKLQMTVQTGDREISKYIMGDIYLK